MSECRFAAVFSINRLNLCYPEYFFEHAPILERAAGCFP